MGEFLYAVVELEDGKSIVMRPQAGNRYEFRLMKDGEPVSNRVSAIADEFPSITKFGETFERNEVLLGYHHSDVPVSLKGRKWAVVRGAAWGELRRMADAIREGKQEYSPDVYRRVRVRMVRVTRQPPA